MNFKRNGFKVDVETLHWWKSVGGMLDFNKYFLHCLYQLLNTFEMIGSGQPEPIFMRIDENQ